jgi:hypothetical protein
MAQENEIWMDIKGYEGMYQVSNLGSVKSLDRKVPHKKSKFLTIRQRILSPSLSGNGYYTVCLSGNGEKPKCIHHLVASTFLGHIVKGYDYVIDHIDNNKLNNQVDNLNIIRNRENSSKTIRGTSKYVGVSFIKTSCKWNAAIRINGAKTFLGNFNSELEASMAYQNALKQLNN